VVGGDDMPGRVGGAAGVDDVLVGLLKLVPILAHLEVAHVKLPVLGRVVKAGLETFRLFTPADVEEEFKEDDVVLAEDFFEGIDPVIRKVVEEHLGASTSKRFAQTEQNVNDELDRLRKELESIDPTLATALDTGRKKINYQLEGLRSRFVRAQMTRDEAAHRQLQRVFDQLYPNKDLQERHINITSLLARHGTYVIEWIYNAINLGSNEHQVIKL